MKILSLWQPWASLVKLNAKRVETRSWPTNYRGPVAIHAAKTWNSECQYYACLDSFTGVLARGYSLDRNATGSWLATLKKTLPFGAIVCIAYLQDCLHTDRVFSVYPDLKTYLEPEFGNYDTGRFAWVLRDVLALTEPLPFKGGQGLRDLPDEAYWEVRRRTK